jgi:predicted RNA-binding protein with PUA-like domain
MAYWLFKTEPDDYSFHDLERQGKGVWDGVRNRVALRNMRSLTPGDEVMIYHTGKEKRVVGLARVSAPPVPDPSEEDPKIVVVEIRASEPLARPVSLAEIKADPAFEGFDLVRLPRLSVMPVPPDHWRRILAMASRKGPAEGGRVSG